MIKKIIFFVSLFFLMTSHVFAASYSPNQFTAQLYDNLGPTLSSVTTSSNEANHSGIIPLQAYSSGGAWGISSPTVMLANHTYTLTANVYLSDCGSLSLSSFNRIGVGTSLGNAVTSYQNNTNVTENYSKVVGPNLIQFAFTPTINSSYVVFAFSSTSSCSSSQVFLTDVSFDDLGSTGVTEIEINNSLNNQTNIINNSISNMEENINNNINDNFNNCGDNTITLTPREKGKYISDPYGNLNTNSYYNVSNFYNINPNTNYTINFNDITGLEYGYLCWYNNTSLVSCSQYREMSGYSATNFIVTSPSNANKITLTYRVNSNANISGNLCINRIDETNNQLGNLNNNITDSNVSGVEESFSRFEDFLDDNSTITQLITLPVTLYSSILQGVSNSCSPFNLGSLYGENLILPCINIGNYLGSTLWGMIDLIISGFAVYSISKKLIKVFNNFSSMKDGDVIDD